jgi:P-type Ca2+ transporter type 2C
MPDSIIVAGLKSEEVEASRRKYGDNKMILSDDRVFLNVLKGVVLEPMFVLLVVSCSVYFILHQQREGFIMLASIFIVAGISFFQEYRSRNAINALKKISSTKATVIREGNIVPIAAEEIVVNDILLVKEGEVIAADGHVIFSNDFAVDESILTGEAFPIFKADVDSPVYKGTLVTSGSANIKVSSVGMKTKFGEIGMSLKNIEAVETPLQLQIKTFVKKMAWFGAIAFLLVFFYNYYQSKSLTFGLLQGLTLAMSVLPEEIPVAFSAFMALGAFRLMKQNVIVKQPQFVETLGSATVICVDKTGTITENRMEIKNVYDACSKISYDVSTVSPDKEKIIEFAMWASETDPFDPMERAIHEAYTTYSEQDRRLQFKQVHEYPLSGKPPLMTHVFSNNEGNTIIACKGAPEAILRLSTLDKFEAEEISKQALLYAQQGFRVLGVGTASLPGEHLPETQEDFSFKFLGVLAFYDPPKKGIDTTIQTFNKAGIQVKIITGDHAATAMAIAKQIHLLHSEEYLTGDEVLKLSEEELQEKVKSVNIFARMFPEAKLKVIEALKLNGEIVSMTGDGVNDAPALKAAQIGIAMGLKGSEVAKGAASLIITDDDLFHMTEAVALGRKIYDNLQKAIQYIVSIHIPIILIVTLPLVLAWKFTNIFTPVHVIFLELIMGPTCSIVYENETMEPGTMNRPPRKLTSTFLSFKQLSISIVQGLIIAAGCLSLGFYYMQQYDETTVRVVIFSTLLFSNIFLTLVNRSFYYSVITTVAYPNTLIWIIIGSTVLLIFSSLYVPPIRQLFDLKALPISSVLVCVTVAIISTFWIELYKLARRRKHEFRKKP